MLEQEQIGLIESKVSVIKDCIEFAHNYLEIPEIEVRFDDCPSKKFPTMDNAAESFLDNNGTGHIIINGPWFVQRIESHQDDVEYFIYHELRHLHQQNQIRLLRKGEQPREDKKVVEEWKKEFENYIRNEDSVSQQKNIRQEVEIDAAAYGIILELLYRDGKSPLLSIPMELADLAEQRLQRYIDTLPEFKKHSIAKNMERQPVKKKTRVGRNAPCPCGSGKKYKKCCGK